MPGAVSCSACGAPLDIPEGLQARWVECPRCRARVVNPQALRITGRLTGTGVLGILLILLGIVGWFFGCGAILLDGLMGHGGEGRSEGYVFLHTVCCAFLVASGVMLLLAGGSKARRPFLLAAAGLGVLAALTLLIASGLIVVFATCLTR
jgi:hypothetical protein